jgi:uncharacterized protein (TIGR02300 family)
MALYRRAANGGSIDSVRERAHGTTPSITSRGVEAVTKPELGTKRSCVQCGAKFYDLNQSPITCPKCGAVSEAVVTVRPRAVPARAPVRELKPESPKAQSHTSEDAGAQGEKNPREASGDEGLDAAFIDEREDTDINEIIGGDVENEKDA